MDMNLMDGLYNLHNLLNEEPENEIEETAMEQTTDATPQLFSWLSEILGRLSWPSIRANRIHPTS